LMQGIIPNTFEWKLRFPGLGAADDELKWDIEGMKATMVKTYMEAGIFLPPEWIVKHVFLDLTPAESDDLIKAMKTVVPPPKPEKPGRGTPAPAPVPVTKTRVRADVGDGDGNGKEVSDEKIEQVIELLKQDEELQRFGERFKLIKRTGINDEYY